MARSGRSKPRLKLTGPARRARRWAIVRGFALTLITAALALGVVIGGLLAMLGPGPAAVHVPEVVGQPMQTAQQILARAGLESRYVGDLYDAEAKPGTVVKQRPEAGMQVKEGRMVELTGSLGPRSATVPKLTGRPLAEVQQLLRERFLQVGRVRTLPSSEPRDLVIKQEPEAGAKLSRDAKVNLVVSGGSSYGAWEVGGREYLFRRLRLVTPQGLSIQRLEVKLRGGSEEQTVYDALHRPGDEVNVDIYGRPGTRVIVLVEDAQVFTEVLQQP